MKRFRIVTLITLMSLLFGLTGVASADDGIGPSSFSSFSFAPSSVYYGDSTIISVDYDTANYGTNYDNVLCFYFDDNGWATTSVWPANGTGSRSGTNSYTRAAAPGLSGVECDPPSVYGRTYVAEYLYTDVVFGVKLFGETVTFNLTVPNSAGPATGVYTFDLVQEEGASDCGDAGTPACTVSDGASANLTLNPTPNTVYVSNTAGCGGNTPCYTGADALQDAFDAVATNGTVNIYGTWSQGGANSAALNSTDNKNVTLTGFNSPRIENGSGTCSGAMIDNQGAGTLTVKSLTIDGTCGSGSRSAGILNSGTGTTNVTDNTNTIRDFTGSGNTGVDVTGGTMVVAGNTFANNYVAMKQSGGTLYAFANNVTSNTGANAAVSTGGGSNVKCNYWGEATISGFGTDYNERLGSTVNNYTEGSGALFLGAASLAAATSGNQVLINLGRDTSNPPFNNGTTGGLGALVSDFYAACLSQSGTGIGAITVSGDSVTPGSTGFRLYQITDAADCSPSDNTACWDHTGDSCSTAGCSVTDSAASENHFVIGNEVDPTAIVFTSVSASSNSWLAVGLVVSLSALALGALFVLRKRRALS